MRETITSHNGQALGVMAMELGITRADGSEFDEDVYLPGKWEICWRCRGNGVHDHPAFSNGFTSDEMHEMGPDFQEEYMQGAYDVRCTICKGSGKTLTPDDVAIKDHPDLEALLQMIHDSDQADWEVEQERQAEIRMGC